MFLLPAGSSSGSEQREQVGASPAAADSLRYLAAARSEISRGYLAVAPRYFSDISRQDITATHHTMLCNFQLQLCRELCNLSVIRRQYNVSGAGYRRVCFRELHQNTVYRKVFLFPVDWSSRVGKGYRRER